VTILTKNQWIYMGILIKPTRNNLLQDKINNEFLCLLIMYSQLSCSDKGTYDVKSVTFSKDTTCLLLRRNKQRTIATLKCSCEDTFVFDTCSLSEICPKNVHWSQITALTRSWKKTQTAKPVSVSNIFITSFPWCCSQTHG
jgi:hypothetical protein